MGFLLYISYHGIFIYSYGILLYGCIPSGLTMAKIKENDFSYKGIVTYSDGKQVTSTFKYDKQYNEVGEEPADALKKEKEFKIHGRLFMQFNNEYTEATFDNDSRPEYIFIKK